MDSLNLMFKRRTSDEREIDHYRHKASNQEFLYTLCKVYETIAYLDVSEVAKLHDTIKATGHIEDYQLGVRSEPGFVKNNAENPIPPVQDTITTESVPPLPTVGPLPPSGLGTLAPLSSHTENRFYASTGWQNNLGSDGRSLEEPDFEEWLDIKDLDLSIFDPQSADSPQFLPHTQVGTTDQTIFPGFPSEQIQVTGLVSTSELNEPVTATANDMSPEPAVCRLQPNGQGSLSYPTPSSSCDSPGTELRELTPATPASTPQKRASKSKSTTQRKRICRQGNPQDTTAEEAFYSLLKECVFERKTKKKKGRKKADVMQEDVEEVRLDDVHVREVIDAGNRLFRADRCGTLWSRVQTWTASASRGQHALGIPSKWRGIEAAADYFTKLRSKKITDTVSSRVAALLLFINYHDMCKRPMNFCPRPPKKGEDKETHVLNCIVETIPDYFIQGLPLDKRRDRVSNVIRYGRWWWRLSHWLGVSVLLLGDDELFQMMKNEMFTNNQIDALITYALRGRPGTVKLFRLSDPFMRELIRGTVSQELKDAFYPGGSRLFTETILQRAHDEDTTLAQENPGVSWTNVVPDNKDPGDSLFAILGIADASQPNIYCSPLLW